jgi:osmotically inducible protein OsmC
MIRKASAVWKGDLKSGKGLVSSQSGGLHDTPYSFHTRFEDGVGVNPEELIAAAHASCFSMALGAQLGERGIVPESVATEAAITFENLSLTKSHLTVTVHAAGADSKLFDEAAKAAKEGCPISKVLNLEITMDANLVA